MPVGKKEIDDIFERITTTDKDRWNVVKQMPGTRLQHNGNALHFVITLAKNKKTVGLSMGVTIFNTQDQAQ
jgi:hypothetical protein